jgi:lysophospholipase L1-like esterase
MNIPSIVATGAPAYYGQGGGVPANDLYRQAVNTLIRKLGRPVFDLNNIWGDNRNPQGYQLIANGYPNNYTDSNNTHPTDIACQIAGQEYLAGLLQGVWQ